MAKGQLLSEDLKADIKSIGVSAFQNWLKENKIKISTNKNFYDDLQIGLEEEKITIDQIAKGLCELEENSNKKIHLYQGKNFEFLKKDKKNALKDISLKFGLHPIPNYSVRVKAREGSTFNYFSWDEDLIKIKYSEKHYSFELDKETGQTVRKEIIVYILMIIDTNDGFVQLRFDTPGDKHTHKSEGRSSVNAFESFYKDLLFNLFPAIEFHDLNLNNVVKQIRIDRNIPYLIHKGVTTITGDAKLIHSWRFKTDIRDLPEFKKTEDMDEAVDWLTEDLSGYWKAKEAEGALNDDLFMRISRKESELRVQRGCLEKELNYGIRKIREIQDAV